MDEYEKVQTNAVEDIDDMLPVGYADGDDFFDTNSWTGDTGNGEAEQESAAAEDFSLDEFLTNGTTVTEENKEDNSAEASTTGKDADTTSPEKLRFQATFDHNTEDVELDPSELPTLYQKARATERAQGRLNEVKPIMDRMDATANLLGYSSVSEMLDATEKSYKDAEIAKLTAEGVHPDIAADLVERRSAGKISAPREEAQPEIQQQVQAPASQRDFKAEVAETLSRFPETQGKSLPNEVIRKALDTGVSLASAYADYKAMQDNAHIEQLKKENSRLKQNADAFARAPVSGVTKGGATDTKPNDPFLSGFNAEKW